MIHKKLEYFLGRAIYSIDNSNVGQLLINIEDLEGKSTATLKLANPQLLTHKTDAEKLYQQVYSQYIFDNKLPKRMLTRNGNQIILNFDYPKVQLKSLMFRCQIVSQDETVIQQLVAEKLNKQGANELEKIFETYRRRIQELASSKLKEVDQKVQNKLQQVSNRLQLDSQDRIQSIMTLYKSVQEEHNARFDDYLISTMKKVEEINQLMIRQHRFAYQKLQGKVVILNDNVKECYAKLNDLTAVIDINNTNHQDELRNLSISVEEKMANVKWSIKEVKEVLSSRIDWILQLNHLKEEIQPAVKMEKEEIFILNEKNLSVGHKIITRSLLAQLQHDYVKQIMEVIQQESQPFNSAHKSSI